MLLKKKILSQHFFYFVKLGPATETLSSAQCSIFFNKSKDLFVTNDDIFFLETKTSQHYIELNHFLSVLKKNGQVDKATKLFSAVSDKYADSNINSGVATPRINFYPTQLNNNYSSITYSKNLSILFKK